MHTLRVATTHGYTDQFILESMCISVLVLVTVLGAALINMARSGSTSPTKKKTGATGSPTKKTGSPKKKNLLEVKVSSTKQARKAIYVFKIIKLKPDVEVIWCEKTPRDDAFIHHLVKHIEEENGFREQGVIMVCRRRMSRLNNDICFNANDAFPRRLIIRVIDDSTPDDRMAVLMLFRNFMMRPEHNRYGYDYVVNASSDLTPHDEAELEPANAFIPDNSIVNLIDAIYENVDAGWYAHNQEMATEFFGDMPYPLYAIEQLGYPDSTEIGGGQFAPGFNLPPAEQDD
jgi:hypothetical protein